MRLNDADIATISAFVGLGEHEFIQRFTRLRPQRDGLALIDKPNGECIFLDGIDCTVQAVKPHQHSFPRRRRVQKTDHFRYLKCFSRERQHDTLVRRETHLAPPDRRRLRISPEL